MENIYVKDVKFNFKLNTDYLDQCKKALSDPNFLAVFRVTDFDTDFIELLDSLNISILGAEVVYTPPNARGQIHIDMQYHVKPTVAKMNWVFDGAGSVMNWYEKKNPGVVEEVRTLPSGESYIFVEDTQCNVVWSHAVAQPSLVNAGILHTVVNSNEPRWCISHALYDKDQQQALQFQDAITKFAPWITP